MGLDAGSVWATLGGRLDPSGFVGFDRAIHNSASKMDAAERRMVASQRRVSAAVAAVGRTARVATVAGLGGFAYALVQSAQEAATFETRMRNVNSIAGLSERQLQRLGERVKELAISSGKMPEDLAAGLYDIVSTGFRADDAIKILAVSTKAAAAGLTDTATATDVMTSALSAYGLGAGHARHVSDILFQAVNVGKLTFEQLAGSIGTILPSAAALDIPLKDVAAAMAAITLNGTSADEAATQLSGVMTQLTKPSEALRKQLHSMGYESGQAAINTLGFKGVLDKLGDAAGGNQQKLQEWFSDIRAVRGVQGLVGTDHAARVFTSSIRAMDTAIKGAGQTQRTYNEQQRSFNFQLDRAKAAMNVLAITAGSQLLPVLTDLAADFTRWVDDLDPAEIEDFGKGIADGLRGFVDVAGDVAGAGRDVVDVLGDVGGALQLDDLDTLLSLGAALLTFKTASTVLPIAAAGMREVAFAASLLGTAIRSGEVAALPGLLAAGVNPVTALATGLAVAAGALVYFSSKEESAADAARAVTEATREQAAAMQELRDQVLATADATFAARHADEDAADAKRQTSEANRRAAAALREHGRGSREYAAAVKAARSALDAENEAIARSTAAHERLRRERSRMAEDAGDAADKTADRIAAARKRLDTELGDAAKDFFNPSTPGLVTTEEFARRTADAWRRYSAEVQKAAKGSAQAALAEMQLTRVLNGQRLITDQHAVSIAKLKDVYNQLPRERQVRLATTAQPALAQIGDLVGALRDVPTQRVVRILASAGSARSQIEALRAAVAGIPPERVVRILSTANSERVKIAALRATIAGMPDRAVTRILANGAVSERVKVLAFTAAARGVPPRAVSKILADGALSEKAKVDALRGSIDSLRDKSVTITTRQLTIHEQRFYNNIMRAPFDRNASGRRAGAGADAIVGEGSRWQGAREAIVDRRTGAAWMVDRPTAVHLSDDHYVIPLDEHRSVAVGLLAGLARELGVDTFAGGRRAPRASAAGNRRRSSGRGGSRRRGGDGNGHGPRWVPPKIAEGGVPFEDVKQRYEQAADALRRARDAESATKKALRKAQDDLKEARSKEQRESAQHEIDRLRKQLATNRRTIAERKPIAARRRRYLDRARETDNKIKNLQTDINVARDAMADADRVDDQAGFDKAKRTRTGKLRSLISLLQRAFELAGRDNRNTDYFRSLKEQLSQLGGTAAVEGRREGFGGELGQAEAEEMDVEQAEAAEPETITDVEERRLDEIEAGIALAALTPTLDDDKARAQELVDFWRGVLESALSDPVSRGGNSAIKEIAESLKAAQDNATALTTGIGSHDNADLQAQLDQERQRRETAETNARISDAAVAALTSSGDIGAGGSNAMGAARNPNGQPAINIYTLHPGDPATLHAIGSAATAGIAYQGMRRSPRQRVGP